MTGRWQLAVAAITLLGVRVAAQQGLAPGDLEILAKVHQANQMEIQVGALAASRAQADRVKRYGDLLARDHRMGDGQVTQLASRKGVSQLPAPVPATPAEQADMQAQMAATDRLKTLSGAEFDRVFTSGMIADHEKAIGMLRSAAQQANDPDVRKLLEGMVPILEQHRDIAQQLHGDLSGR